MGEGKNIGRDNLTGNVLETLHITKLKCLTQGVQGWKTC